MNALLTFFYMMKITPLNERYVKKNKSYRSNQQDATMW